MTRPRLRWLLVVAGVLLWLLAVLPAYYVVHHPLSADNLRALANVAGDVLTWLLMLTVATALGSWLTRRLAYHSLLERIAFSAGAGLAVFSLVTLGLGFVGALHSWLLWALLLGGGLLLWPAVHDLARRLRGASWPRPKGAWPTFLSVFIVTTLALAFTLALTPPIEWDSLTYHLVGPERNLQAHRLTFELDNYYLLFPSFTEMLFTAGMGLKGDVVPRLIHFGYLLMTLGALAAFATRYWKRHTGLLAGALFLSIPTAVHIASWAYVDLALTFYSFAALYALLNGLRGTRSQAGQTGWLALAGLFAGVSLSIKYTGYVSLVVLLVVLAWHLLRRQLTIRRFLSISGVVVALALALAAPWYIKNLVVAGNPIYPLVWGGRGWNDVATRWLLVLGEEKSALDLLLLPWTLTVMGKQGTVPYDATFSPLFLILLPMLLLIPRRAPGITHLVVAAVVGYVAWIVNGAAAYGRFVLQGRQLLPTFAPLALLSALSLEGLPTRHRRSFSLRRFLTLLTGLVLAFHLLSQALLTVGLNPMPYLVGVQSREGYQDQYISQRWHQAISYVNQNLTEADRVLFIWEPRSYGCKVPHEADVLFDNVSQLLARYGTPTGMAAGLQREGFTHLLVNHYVYGWIATDYPITSQERAMWQDFQARYLTQETRVHAEGEFLTLYCLVPEK